LKPPALTVYEQYREQAERYDWILPAPIPFSPRDYLRDQGDTGLQSPSQRHWFGTEENGADVFSRMIHASRIALGIGFVATGIAMLIGIIIGGLMGYFSGVWDIIGMRLVEIFEAVPTLFLLLTFVAFFGRSLYIMMVIIGITSWPGYARYVRAEFLKLRRQDYVQAAVAAGLPLRSILFRHMLPNGIAPVLVGASFGVASAILAEATLSFLGLGLVDAPSWGEMLNQAVRSSSFNWWMAAFPGGAIFLTVLSYNLIGDSLRDAIDPHLAAQPEGQS
jgi:peptide/nickel transport system permease protein